MEAVASQRNKASDDDAAQADPTRASSPSMFDADRMLTAEGADRSKKALIAKNASLEFVARLNSAVASDELGEAHRQWVENWVARQEAGRP